MGLIEFISARIRNPNTRKAYAHAAQEFGSRCERNGFDELRDIEPVHIPAYIEQLQDRLAAPSVKQDSGSLQDQISVFRRPLWPVLPFDQSPASLSKQRDAAARVSSITSASWLAETKPASNAEGAR